MDPCSVKTHIGVSSVKKYANYRHFQAYPWATCGQFMKMIKMWDSSETITLIDSFFEGASNTGIFEVIQQRLNGSDLPNLVI